MTIEISAFAWVPPFAQGYVKDIRPRWALAEAGLDHAVRAVAGDEADGPAYRAWQPFGQVPAYRDEAVELFEPGRSCCASPACPPLWRPATSARLRGRRPGSSRRSTPWSRGWTTSSCRRSFTGRRLGSPGGAPTPSGWSSCG